jgi:hypothetical protein
MPQALFTWMGKIDRIKRRNRKTSEQVLHASELAADNTAMVVQARHRSKGQIFLLFCILSILSIHV